MTICNWTGKRMASPTGVEACPGCRQVVVGRGGIMGPEYPAHQLEPIEGDCAGSLGWCDELIERRALGTCRACKATVELIKLAGDTGADYFIVARHQPAGIGIVAVRTDGHFGTSESTEASMAKLYEGRRRPGGPLVLGPGDVLDENEQLRDAER